MTPASGPSTVHALFEEVARQSPERTAVRHHLREVSYRSLSRMANHCRCILRQHGVGPEVLVGLCGARSPELVAALLGVLKAGGGYVPIDLEYPPDTIRQMLRHAGVSIVIMPRSIDDAACFAGVTRIHLEAVADASGDGDEEAPSDVAPDNVALVVHTSGSAGAPKAVALTHRAIVARLEHRRYSVGTVPCQKASMSVVAHVGDMLMPLVDGRSVYIVDDADVRTPQAFARAITAGGVTIVMVLPSQLRALLENEAIVSSLDGLRWVVVSGEALPPAIVRACRARLPHVRIMNGYGLSETCGAVTRSIVADGADIGAGQALPPSTVYVLDDHLEPVAADTVGEVCVGSAQLARGYLRMPALTAERFVPNPWGSPGERLFRTGDAGRLRADGSLELAGRIDTEVKLRGLRVNLLDVERALTEHDSVEMAAVVLHAAGEQSRLTAYVVPACDSVEPRAGLPPPDAVVLRAHLKNRLPSHMIPSRIDLVDDLPLLPNGKVDRMALSRRAANHAAPAHDDGAVEERSDTESSLAAMWSEVLGVADVTSDSAFFELGGDSLAAMRILTRISDNYGIELPIHELLEGTTVRTLAAALERCRLDAGSTAGRVR